MSYMFEVTYKSPPDSRREATISERIGGFGGQLTYREEPQGPGGGPICLTFEFPELLIARSAASILHEQGEHVEGPEDYGD